MSSNFSSMRFICNFFGKKVQICIKNVFLCVCGFLSLAPRNRVNARAASAIEQRTTESSPPPTRGEKGWSQGLPGWGGVKLACQAETCTAFSQLILMFRDDELIFSVSSLIVKSVTRFVIV